MKKVKIFLLVFVFTVLCFAAATVTAAFIRGYDNGDYGYGDWNWNEYGEDEKEDKSEGDDDPLRYYNYRRGGYVEIPEPDPAEIAYGSGPSGFGPEPVGLSIPFFVILWLFLLWLLFLAC